MQNTCISFSTFRSVTFHFREKEELFKSICSTEDVKNMVQILKTSSNLPLHDTE